MPFLLYIYIYMYIYNSDRITTHHYESYSRFLYW
uniref:Uncharacterized protein n=1 Tax=Heterorhabditis bacteriophora TaxID=37862 RepID=A0A1I7W8G3_HETBA